MTGFLLVDKPKGPTSHDVVAVVRRIFKVKRVGHAGTLDPPASGLLVIAVGPATRLLPYVQGLAKTYEVTGALGVTTTTLDAAGEVVERRSVDVKPSQLREAAATLTGEIRQVPPAVSAISVGGERSYKKARRGEAVEHEPRPVTVYAFDILRTSPTAFDARVVCSTGTYVRSLVADLGEKVGCGAHVVNLRRTAIGHLVVKGAPKPDQITTDSLVAVEDVLTHLPRLDVTAEQAKDLRDGKRLPDAGTGGGQVLVVGPEGAVGVFERRDGEIRALTVIGTSE